MSPLLRDWFLNICFGMYLAPRRNVSGFERGKDQKKDAVCPSAWLKDSPWVCTTWSIIPGRGVCCRFWSCYSPGSQAASPGFDPCVTEDVNGPTVSVTASDCLLSYHTPVILPWEERVWEVILETSESGANHLNLASLSKLSQPAFGDSFRTHSSSLLPFRVFLSLASQTFCHEVMLVDSAVYRELWALNCRLMLIADAIRRCQTWRQGNTRVWASLRGLSIAFTGGKCRWSISRSLLDRRG